MSNPNQITLQAWEQIYFAKCKGKMKPYKILTQSVIFLELFLQYIPKMKTKQDNFKRNHKIKTFRV